MGVPLPFDPHRRLHHGPRVHAPRCSSSARDRRRRRSRPATSSRRCRSRSPRPGMEPVGAYSNVYNGGYAELHAAHRGDVHEGPERSRPPARRAHRADGGRAPRGRARRGHARGSRGRARRGTGRARGGRRAAPARRRDDRRQRLLAAPARGRARDGRDARRSIPRPTTRSTRGNAADGRRTPVVFDAIGVPGSLGPRCSAAPPMSRVVRRRLVHAAGHDPPAGRRR